MARRFAKVSEEEIVTINEAAFFDPSDLVNTKTTENLVSYKESGYVESWICGICGIVYNYPPKWR